MQQEHTLEMHSHRKVKLVLMLSALQSHYCQVAKEEAVQQSELFLYN